MRQMPPAVPDLLRRRLLKAAASSAWPLAAHWTPGLAASGLPRGLHASFTGDVRDTRTLTWFTDGADDPGSVVEYGPVTPDMTPVDIASAPLPIHAVGAAMPTFGVDALTHAATMTGLDPGLPVRYRVGSPAGWSEIHTLPAAPAGPFRFCHFGDHGMTDASRAVRDATVAAQPDFVIIAGDLSYANGDQPQWDLWFDHLAPLAARIPVMTAPGNHEEEDNGGQAYRSRVTQPGHTVRYAWDYGRLHFLFSTGGSLLGRNLQADVDLIQELQDMEADLADAAARRARGEIDFIIVVQHYTIWTDEDGRDPASPALVLLEEGMLLRYGVDLLLVGHDHIYQRSHPMGRGRPFDAGYVQVTQGGGGKSLYELLEPQSEWSAFATLRYGFSEFTVDGATITGVTRAVDTPDNRITDGTPEEIDRFELTRRSPLECRLFARPPRRWWLDPQQTQALLENTRQRNWQHHRLGR